LQTEHREESAATDLLGLTYLIHPDAPGPLPLRAPRRGVRK